MGMKVNATLRTLSLCALLAAVPAYATPFSVAAPTTAERGETVTVSLLFDGSASDLEGALFGLTFDSSVFRYLSPQLEAAEWVGSSSLYVGKLGLSPLGDSLRKVDFSWATALGPADNGPLVGVRFLIEPKAPFGPSSLVFESLPRSDYEILPTIGTVTVTPGQTGTVPEPASSMLLGVGMVALLASRRRLA